MFVLRSNAEILFVWSDTDNNIYNSRLSASNSGNLMYYIDFPKYYVENPKYYAGFLMYYVGKTVAGIALSSIGLGKVGILKIKNQVPLKNLSKLCLAPKLPFSRQ